MRHRFIPRPDSLGLAAALAVAFAVRAFAWSRTAVMFNDGPIFLALAEAIGEGRWAEVLVHPYHPLYPALIAFVALFGVDLETSAVLISILGGLISVAALFYFVRQAFDREVALLAAWVLALHPWAIDFTSDVMSDGIYMGLFLVGFAAMAKVVGRPTIGNGGLCGLAAGFAYLGRPEGAGLLVAGAGLLMLRVRRDRADRGRAAAACLAMLLSGAAVIGPFVTVVGLETGEFALTQKKAISRLIADPSNPAVLEDARRKHERLFELNTELPLPELAIRADGQGAKRPARTWVGVLGSIHRVGLTSMAAFRFELIALALVGLWTTRRSGKSLRTWTIGVPIFLYSGLMVLLVWGAGYLGRRHTLPAWLPLIGYSAVGARVLWTKCIARLAGQNAALIARLDSSRTVCVALVILLTLIWGARDLRSRRDDREPVRAAAEWLAENRPGSGPVAAQKRRIAYYAGATFVPLPPGHDGGLADYLRRRGARWVVIDDAKLLDHLGLETGIGSWLRPVHSVSSNDRNAIVLAVEAEAAR